MTIFASLLSDPRNIATAQDFPVFPRVFVFFLFYKFPKHNWVSGDALNGIRGVMMSQTPYHEKQVNVPVWAVDFLAGALACVLISIFKCFKDIAPWDE